MNVSNIHHATAWFEVLQTTDRSQTAVMTLKPGQSTGEQAESHKDSQQMLLLIEGELLAELDDEHGNLNAGDVVVIPPGVKHKFTNKGTAPAMTDRSRPGR
jgi:mannose-6-phosphate isomerase-like protein (cupin superfamily)